MRAVARHLAKDEALQRRVRKLIGDTYGEDAIRKILTARKWLRAPA
jgi:myo-inositol catabolism protein IolC